MRASIIILHMYHDPLTPFQGARELVQRMLCVDPLQRATMRQVRNHPWFLVSRPDLCVVCVGGGGGVDQQYYIARCGCTLMI